MMKNIIAIALTFLAVGIVSAQQKPLKIGYVDVDYILSEMPETKQIESDLKVHQSQLQNQLQSKMANYQKMIQEYQGGAATMTDVIRQDKEREIAQLEENIQKFQQDAQVSFQKKQTELLQPVYEKIGKAIEEVANEGSFTYVLSTRIGSIDVILFAIPENDISDLVLKKMGITPQNN
jgi:outer membrane protein